jgi:hypothetical protein
LTSPKKARFLPVAVGIVLVLAVSLGLIAMLRDGAEETKDPVGSVALVESPAQPTSAKEQTTGASLFDRAPACGVTVGQRSPAPLRKIGDFVYAPHQPAGWVVTTTNAFVTQEGPEGEGTLRGVTYARTRADLTAPVPGDMRIRVAPLAPASTRAPEAFLTSLVGTDEALQHSACKLTGSYVMLQVASSQPVKGKTIQVSYVVLQNLAKTKAAFLTLEYPVGADIAAGLEFWTDIQSLTRLN